MKFRYIFLTILPLALAALPPAKDKQPTFCKCAPIKCPTTQPALCECENQNAISCAKLCGTKPLIKPCPKLIRNICGFDPWLPPCPKGQTCIDDPEPNGCNGPITAADCPGLCVTLDGPFCGGIANIPCPDPGNQVCVDDPRDNCRPPNGADCSGTCVYLDGRSSNNSTQLVEGGSKKRVASRQNLIRV